MSSANFTAKSHLQMSPFSKAHALGFVLFESAFWGPSGNPLLRTPSENPSQNHSFFTFKTHSKRPSKNPSENPSLPRTFSEPLLERYVAVRPLGRIPEYYFSRDVAHSKCPGEKDLFKELRVTFVISCKSSFSRTS